MDGYPAAADRIARVQARRLARVTAVPFDDLHQEARLVAWQWCREQWQLVTRGYLPNVAWFLASRTRQRLLDWLRVRGRGWGERDLPLSGFDQSCDAADADMRQVDAREAAARVIAAYPGPRRHAEVAWLHAHGHPDTDLAAHYGVSAARVGQWRRAFYARSAEHWP